MLYFMEDSSLRRWHKLPRREIISALDLLMSRLCRSMNPEWVSGIICYKLDPYLIISKVCLLTKRLDG